MKQKVQKQLHPLFSNKTFPPDSSSFVIQFHFPLDAKGLKAFVRSPWSHLSALIERPEGQIIQIHSGGQFSNMNYCSIYLSPFQKFMHKIIS